MKKCMSRVTGYSARRTSLWYACLRYNESQRNGCSGVKKGEELVYRRRGRGGEWVGDLKRWKDKKGDEKTGGWAFGKSWWKGASKGDLLEGGRRERISILSFSSTGYWTCDRRVVREYMR
jgi:hypothetical protein